MVARLNLEAMFKEIETIYKKYGLPKGMFFVPDKLEIILERKGIDKFDLTYSEFFNYLPDHALNIAMETTIQFMSQIGFPPEKIIRTENGVKVQTSGDFQIAFPPIIEILLQNKGKDLEIKSILDSISKIYEIFANFLVFQWDWNDETESIFKNYLTIFTGGYAGTSICLRRVRGGYYEIYNKKV